MRKEQTKRLQGIARYLTGSQLQDMAKSYARFGTVTAPKGQQLHGSEFVYLCGYLRTTPEKVLGGGQ
jgi:hypothetical protein